MSASAKNLDLKFQDNNIDFQNGIEVQLKELWSQYVKCLDENGSSEVAQSLRNAYYDIYRNYRNNRKWREAVEG
ncbi:MAG: hypothetical protein ACXVCY_07330 [Pseudobdellovibrionaceae bacterium]